MGRLKVVMSFVMFVGNHLRIPPYVLRVQKVAVLLLIVVHLCTCCYWFVKTVTRYF